MNVNRIDVLCRKRFFLLHHLCRREPSWSLPRCWQPGSGWVAALTVMAMDVRHVLYGPSLRSRIITASPGTESRLWAFGLTDEVFCRRNRRNRYAIIAAGANWMIGIAFSSSVIMVVRSGNQGILRQRLVAEVIPWLKLLIQGFCFRHSL
ncbi:AzlC family ABC transporter permease [Escherichia coli]